MSRWHNQYADAHAHFCTLTVAHWRSLLDDDAVRVLYYVWTESRQALGAQVLSFVVMPDHIHVVLRADRGASIKEFMHRTASLTSRELQPGGGFWKERPRVVPVYSPSVLRTKVDYIHHNPVRRGLAACPDEWVHSSFRQIVLGRSDVPFLCDAWESVCVG